MIKSVEVFRKLYFLIILAVFNYIPVILATQTESVPDMPPLEDFLKTPTTTTTATTSPSIDTNKIAEKKPTKWSFFQLIKDFFTFKAKEQTIKPVEVETAGNVASEDEQESFIDVGNSKLPQVPADANNQANSLDAFKQFQEVPNANENALKNQTPPPAMNSSDIKDESSAQQENSKQSAQTNVASPAREDNNTKVLVDAVPDIPTLQNVQNQNNGSKNNNLPAAPTVQDVRSTTPVTTTGVDKVMLEASKQDPKTAANSGVATNSPASLTPIPNEIKQAEIPKLPEIPANLNDNPKDDSNKQTAYAPGDYTKKVEIPKASAKEGSKDLIAVSDKSTSVTNVQESLQMPIIPEVPSPSVPSVPSVEITSATESTKDIDKIRGTNKDAESLGDLSKFVLDEAKVLLLPDDDVVLGELTETALIEQMDFLSYSKIYESQLTRENRYNQRLVIENFLKTYDTNFNNVPILTDEEAADQAFAAINRNNLFSLRTLLDNNRLLQVKNEQGDSLLHVAVELDNYSLTKFLIIRGINLSVPNMQQKTPFMISEELGAADISRLLRSAKASIK